VSHALVVRVTWHAERFHGRPDWPPAPARLFQAVVAGAGPNLSAPEVHGALRWLESLAAPTILAPRMRDGQEVTLFVPNNDLDAVDGDPERVPEIRTAKSVHPRLLEVPHVTYVWPFEDSPAARTHAHHLVALAERLYQLGRGTDPAWAVAEVVDAATAAQRIDAHDGTVHRPTPGGEDRRLACPRDGTLDSLQVRFDAQARFRVEGSGRIAVRVFVQPPKAVFREVGYDSGPERLVFELRDPDDPARFAPVPLPDVHAFVVACRDAAVERLVGAGMDRGLAEASLVGPRKGETAQRPRVRLVPLPSIGHEHTDPRVRRLLVEVPRGTATPARDLRWAFVDLAVGDGRLVPSPDASMLGHYVRASREWSSVTPLALSAARRRIDPARVAEEAKGAPEREQEEALACAAVRDAVRHAAVGARVVEVAVSREPVRVGGERAERFAAPPRFGKERLWHVRVVFDRAVVGPVVLGDGRWLGLGLLAPTARLRRVRAWRITAGLADGAAALEVAHHLRRAVLAVAQRAWGRASLPAEITGHRADGSPAAGHRHLSYLADLPRSRVLIYAPDGFDPRLDQALDQLVEVRAGKAGLLRLEESEPADGDALLGTGEEWRTVTPYRVERHGRHPSAASMVEADVRAACRRAGREPVEVRVSGVRTLAGAGVEADVALRFAAAWEGPLLLGRTRHVGGGVFALGSVEAS
jgi:CRISPR-associated protein Csb2